MTEPTQTERIVTTLAGAIVLIGVVGIGMLEMIAGSPHAVTGEGQIVHEALVGPGLRATIVLIGLVLFGLYAIYAIATKTPAAEAETEL